MQRESTIAEPSRPARRPRRPRRWSGSTKTRRIVAEAEDEVIALLEGERGRLDALAHALLEQETLDQADAYRIAGVEEPASESDAETRAASG